jgi:hypothetical protein
LARVTVARTNWSPLLLASSPAVNLSMGLLLELFRSLALLEIVVRHGERLVAGLSTRRRSSGLLR